MFVSTLRSSVSLVLLSLFLLVAPAFGQATISVYHRNELREIEWIQQVKEAFEAANPDIRVELVQGTGGGGAPYAERLAVLFASGNPPDVFYGSTDKAGFILNGWAHDITALIERDREAMGYDEFFPGIFQAATRQGRIYGVPAIAMGQSLFINKRLFEEAGLALPPIDWNDPSWTWEAFIESAQKLTRAREDGTLEQAGVSSINQFDIVRMFGGEIFPPEAFETGIAPYATLLDPVVEQAYNEVQRLYTELRVAAASPGSGINAGDGFAQGQIAMDWAGWWKIRNYLDTVDFEWSMAPMPLVQTRANTRYSDPWFIASNTKNLEAAWRFVKFVTGREGLNSFARHVAFPPSRQTTLAIYLETVSNASGMSEAEALTAISGAIEHSVAALDEVVGGNSVWNPILTEELSPAWQGQRSVRESLESAQRRINAALEELASRWRR